MHQRRNPTPRLENVQRAVRWATEELGNASVDSPRLTAELLLGHILGWDRVRLLSHGDDALNTSSADRFASLIQRRAAGEPLQYLTGVQEFFGLPFRVTPAVLIPRPETEILVEKALSLARGFEGANISFVDVGAGSGCIAVSFAHDEPRAAGWAVDISCPALEVAHENAKRNHVLERVSFVCGDLLDCFSPRQRFEFILSNPPYVARRDAHTLPAVVLNHEPQTALFSGDSETDIYARLISQAARLLADGGYLVMEVGAGMAESVGSLAAREGLTVESIENDLQAIPRCVVARRGHG